MRFQLFSLFMGGFRKLNKLVKTECIYLQPPKSTSGLTMDSTSGLTMDFIPELTLSSFLTHPKHAGTKLSRSDAEMLANGSTTLSILHPEDWISYLIDKKQIPISVP